MMLDSAFLSLAAASSLLGYSVRGSPSAQRTYAHLGSRVFDDVLEPCILSLAKREQMDTVKLTGAYVGHIHDT